MYEYIWWQWAAAKGILQAWETLRFWGKGATLNTDELLLVESEDGKTAFQLAAGDHHIETLKILWVWAEESKISAMQMR